MRSWRSVRVRSGISVRLFIFQSAIDEDRELSGTVLLEQVVNDRLLVPVDPAGEEKEEEGEWGRQRIHTHLRPVHEIPAHERLAEAVPIADLVTLARKRASGKPVGDSDGPTRTNFDVGTGREDLDKHTRSKTAGDQGRSREIGAPVSLLGLLLGLIQAQMEKLRQKQTYLANSEGSPNCANSFR